jgi:hypothetical protein
MNDDDKPPKFAEKLLSFFMEENDLECICGDLAEKFKTGILPKYGALRAKLWYWKEALLCVGYLAARGRMRSSLPMILIGVGIGVVVFLLSWANNRKPGVTIFPDGFIFLVLLCLTFFAVWLFTRKIEGYQRTVVRRVAFKISAIIGVVFGAGITYLCFMRSFRRVWDAPFFIMSIFMFLISLASALVCGSIASSLLLFVPAFRAGLRGSDKEK